MTFDVYFDGSCGPSNPGGTAAWGYLVKNDKGEVVHSASGRACRGINATNNVAEYAAIVEAMGFMKKQYPNAHVVFNGDSSLVISQMKGESQARGGKYLPYYERAKALARPFIEKRLWSFNWIQRALNSEADELAQYHRY